MTNQVKRYNRRYIIPDWDAKGNGQMFVQQEDGTWLDTFNETTRTQNWIDQHIAPYFKLAPSNVATLNEFMQSLEDGEK
jgi:hypothetical protein